MSFFEKNMKIAETRFPKIADRITSAVIPDNHSVIVAKSGQPVLKIGSIALHSGYYPEKEAEKIIAGASFAMDETVVMFGFGFGYHLRGITREVKNVIVVEPSDAVLKLAFTHVDLADILERATIVSPDEFDEAVNGLDYNKARWMEHDPTGRLYPDTRDRLREPFIVRMLASARRYRALVVGPCYGGSVPTAASVARALRALNFETDFMDNTPRAAELFSVDSETSNPNHKAALRTIFTNYLGERVAARAGAFSPDVIIALAQAPIPPHIVDRLKSLEIPVIFWFVENFRALPYWKSVAPRYDYFFGIQQGEFIDKLKEEGAPYAGYLPQAADPAIHHPIQLSDDEKIIYGGPLSFMGAGYPNRKKFFATLLDTPLKIWGTEWDLRTPVGMRVRNTNRRLAPEEYVKIFAGSEINLNLHSCSTHSGIDPIGDFVNPRTFEIAACGAFQLVDARNDLSEMFEIGKELVTYDSAEDLREKIDYYSRNRYEREKIAQAGMKRVLREHTFVHRIAKMMSVVLPLEEQRIESARNRRRGVNDVDSIIERTTSGELARFLETFRGQGNLSLVKVMDKIERGDGPLSRTEAIFVMMDQLLSQGGR